MKTISVVVPSFNEEKYIEPTLRKLKCLKGNGKNVEIIVSDGGSTDRTVRIAKKYADKVVISRQRGIGFGKNLGAQLATNDIIAFTDADTVVGNDWLRQIALSFRKPSVVGVAGKVLALSNKYDEKAYYSLVFNKFLVMSHMLGKPIFVGSNCAVLKSAFNRIGGFRTDINTGEDHDLGVRLARAGKVIYNPKMIVYTSPRKERKFGIKKMMTRHIRNYVYRHMLDKDNYKSRYVVVR